MSCLIIHETHINLFHQKNFSSVNFTVQFTSLTLSYQLKRKRKKKSLYKRHNLMQRSKPV